MDPRRRPFRFEAAWLSHDSFKDLLRSSWDNSISTPAALVKLQGTLRKWNWEVFGDITRTKDALLAAIKEVQDALELTMSDSFLQQEDCLIAKLDETLAKEEMLWFQKSREKWIALGDRNTTFFHMSTVIRRRRNRIETLKGDDGVWISNGVELEKLAIAYYKRLYSLEDVDDVVDALPRLGFPGLSDADMRHLSLPFSHVEVLRSVRSMGKFKAPGPDGFQPVFYQTCWEEVGPSVITFVLNFFATGMLPRGLNDALVVLIPKVGKPETIAQFRPIGLCNVLFKVITKMMVLRLKSVMSKLIGPAQVSFIPGRLSSDNIVVVQEVVHSMRCRKGRKGWMLLKLDLEKAYDRIRWDFLEDTIIALNLPGDWCKWIMQSVSGSAMRLLWNGELTESFSLARGLRQGDPLSPYLFVLCLERLCHLIEDAVNLGEWKPICLSRGGPKLSHICFADDLILFAEASVEQINVIRSILHRFCIASGQKVSLDKSKIFFSKNVSRELATSISAASGISATTDLGKYLGMPVLQQRVNKETFQGVLERVSSKLAGWKGRTLSMAGRITLTRSVLSSIPVHSMSTASLPLSTLNALDRVSRSFVWGDVADKRKIHLMRWSKICTQKSEGGLGIRVSKTMNQALLSKLGWRLLHDHSSLWARLLRSKYKITNHADSSWLLRKGNYSSTWRHIRQGLIDVVLPGLSWVIGNGRCVRFWSDKWLIKTPLLELTTTNLPSESNHVCVSDLWQSTAGWLWQSITPFLPENLCLQLRSVIVDEVTGAVDRISWPGSSSGVFTVASAYKYLSHRSDARPDMSAFFERVWRVCVPERVRLFLWFGVHQILLTNKERCRRQLSDSSMCSICRSAEESVIHVLRDCPAMEGIWKRIVPPRLQVKFFDQSILEWLYDNLCNSESCYNCPWSTTFAMTVWWGWKWRCGYIFGDNVRCRDRVKFIKELGGEIYAASQTSRVTYGSGERVTKQISWRPPPESWIRLNTDGASRGNPGLATAGGVLRDSLGVWKGGFAFNIGICTAPLAELWGVYYGLYLAWERGFSCLELEVDSKIVVEFLHNGVNASHPLSFLVQLCHGFLKKDWLVRVTHIYREANKLADGLANFAFSLPLGYHLLDTAPDPIQMLVLEDMSGISYPRSVCFS